ncbi:MAG TPA: twin-arginine translocase TatA/TatE family subunit [Acidimicrobiales bacterium]
MGPEWWIVIGVIVLLFGGSQLPKLARSIGKSQAEFKKGLSEGAKDEGKAADDGKAGSAGDTENK